MNNHFKRPDKATVDLINLHLKPNEPIWEAQRSLKTLSLDEYDALILRISALEKEIGLLKLMNKQIEKPSLFLDDLK